MDKMGEVTLSIQLKYLHFEELRNPMDDQTIF